MLHGTFCSHHEFHLLLSTPHLQDCHILLPDLPRHGQSSSLNVPLTLPTIAALLADLVIEQGKKGKADVVGSDIGGYAALYLASKYPELVSSVFVTGCERSYASRAYSTWMAVKIYFGAVLGMVLFPRSWLLHLLKKLDSEMNEDLILDMEKTISWSYCSELFNMLHRDWGTGKEICEAITARTLIVAAGRQDLVEGVRERGEWLRKGMGERTHRAVVVQGARHAWVLQLGKVDLFARGIKAWVQYEELPVDFENLDGVD